MSRQKYTDEQFINAVKSSNSIAETLRALGLKPVGGNYGTVRNKIALLGLSSDHFVGQSWSKGQTIGPKRDIECYLNNEVGISSDKLKRRLIGEGIFERKCYGCGNTEWLGEPIPLELDHINGKHKDNTLSNLNLLCPNCHTLTPTYRGKNIGKAV
jgi:hypothetical protein